MPLLSESNPKGREMKFLHIKGLTLLLGLIILYSLTTGGCQKGDQDSSSVKALPDNTVAMVNNVPITEKEFLLFVSQFESMNPDGFKEMSEEQKKDFFANIIGQLISRQVLLQVAEKEKIEISDDFVEYRFQALKSQFSSEEAFLEVLRKGKTNPELWKKGTKETFLIRALEELVSQDIEVTDEEIQNYWTSNQDSFKKDLVQVRQVLVKTEPEAEQVLSVLDKGKPFEEVVQEYSIDLLTKNLKGEMGWVSRGSSFKGFDEAIFHLEPLSISPPIKSPYGYHILQVLGKKPANEVGLEDFQEKIIQVIRQQKWFAQRDTWIEQQKQEANIQVIPYEELSSS